MIFRWRIAAYLLLSVVTLCSVEFTATESARSTPVAPDERELAQIVGQALSSGFKSVRWKTGTLSTSNVVVYNVEPPRYSEPAFARLADALGIKGAPTRMPSDFVRAPGYWIKEANPTNHLRFKSLLFSELTGEIVYGNGEDNHRWDLKNQRPSGVGVPTPEEALHRTLDLLPALGLSTDDLEHYNNGMLRWDSNNEGTLYTDRDNGQRKRYIRQMNIILYQRMPFGGSIAGAGGGGQLRAGYMSEGKLAELDLLFRRVAFSHTLKSKAKADIVSALRKGKGRTFYEHVPDTITVTNCTLVYPQGNLMCIQASLWPFYSVKGFAVESRETNHVIVYIPAAW